MALRGSLAPVPEDAVVLGVDLGTHYSSAGVWLRDKLYLAPDERGEVCVPSVVHISPRGLVVGAEADRLRASDPASTVAGVKRLLGRRLGDGPVRLFEAQSCVPLTMSRDGGLAVSARGRTISAVEIASAIFRYLKERMERRIGGRISRTIVTVPVASPRAAREATAKAARMAGLEVLRVVAEPCAAAVALRLPDRNERRLLVYDFGGGTFDAAVVVVRGESLVVVGSGGDDCLGGDDFDEAMARRISSHLWQSARVDVSKDAVRWPRILRHAERVKRALSTSETTRFRLDDAWSDRGVPQGLDLTLARGEVEASWSELVERSIKASAEVMMQAGLRPSALHGVAMVGGTTLVPLVRREVSRVLGTPMIGVMDPQTAVAGGAAMLAAQPATLNAA